MHATTSPKAIDLKPALLAVLGAVLLTAGIIIGSAMDLRIAPTTASVAAPDTSYNAVEGARAQFGVAPDTSYDTVESLRAQSGVTVDTAPSVAGKSGFPSTRGRGISGHDKARGFAGWWASAPVAGTPVSQADPDSRYGAGIR
jgi:hypothetical protein